MKIDASGSRPGSSPIVSYTWSFGNGTGQPASPNPTVVATYNTTGMYEITVVVADANGLPVANTQALGAPQLLFSGTINIDGTAVAVAVGVGVPGITVPVAVGV